MVRSLEILVVVLLLFKAFAQGADDLTPEAITVYRNPEFFKNLNYNPNAYTNQNTAKVPQETAKNYKYPGETKKPNPPLDSPGFEINYDNSPEFHHEPRDIFVDTAHKPPRKKGPYSPRYETEHQGREKPAGESESEEEGSRESKESQEEPRDFVSVFNESPEEEFRAYHEPVLLARPSFDPTPSTRYDKPYPYNRTRPILYDEWKFYTYPKIYANKHLKSREKLYSEEPSSNYFDDESPSYLRNDDEAEDASSFFEADEFKNLGADTKHIYKKLLKPKKSFLFKFHSKPKFKKLKFKLKKKHLQHSDWFDEYPFDF